jgi:hypothetical protein
MKEPHVSVFVPCFNEERSLPTFLESLSNQSYSNFTALFFDNASLDSSAEIIKCHATRDRRIELVRFDNNVSRTVQWLRIRNSASSSPFIAIRSANDEISSDYFQETVRLLIDNPEVGLSYSHGDLLDLSTDTRVTADSRLKIDTRGKSLEAGVHEVLSRYTHSFSLWGVYRREVLHIIAPLHYCYAADHVHICEVSIYTKIASTPGRHCTMTKNGAESPLESIRRMWLSHHPLVDHGVDPDSIFMTTDIKLPFTSMIKGHLLMIAGAKISDDLKQNLQKIALDTLKQRFHNLLEFEHRNFLAHFWNTDISHVFARNRLGISSFVDSLIQIRCISPHFSDHCNVLLKKSLAI